MQVRRLVAPLLLLVPFLNGACGRANITAAPAEIHASTGSVLGQTVAPAEDTPLASISRGGSPLEAVQATSGIRAPIRVPRHGTDSPIAVTRPVAAAHSRAIQLKLASLAHKRTELRARTNVPVTYGNPPPTSLS